MEPTLQNIESLAHTHLADCYQCGKCTAGCPVSSRMDLMPNQLLRQVQLGLIDRAMRSEALWQCVSCQTCSTRCPKQVDCAGVMDALRQLAVENNAEAPGQRRTTIFQKAFLGSVRRNGRVSEVELIGEFKTRAFLKELNIPFLMKDALLAPQLIKRGKFHLVGEKVHDRAVVERIFERCLNDTTTSDTPENGAQS